MKILRQLKPTAYNLSLKKVNRVKNLGSGNIIGKAIQKLNFQEN